MLVHTVHLLGVAMFLSMEKLTWFSLLFCLFTLLSCHDSFATNAIAYRMTTLRPADRNNTGEASAPALMSVSDYQCKNDKSHAIQRACARSRSEIKRFFPHNQTLFQAYRPTADKDIKYFRESPNDQHRDIRFYNGHSHSSGKYQREKRHVNLVRLLHAWTEFTTERNLTYWLAHGLLIGHYWNNQILPWDLDLDVQVSSYDLLNEYKAYHKTMHKNRYLFDINPHSTYRLHQFDNVIDGRFIDTTNGLYLDITGVSWNSKRSRFQCKTPHYYKYSELFPLHSAVFCNRIVWVPNDIESILVKEYKSSALKSDTYVTRQGVERIAYRFHQKAKRWVAIER